MTRAAAVANARPDKAKTWEDALRTLSRPVPPKFVKQKPDKSKADYVPHHIIRQYLHAVFDNHSFVPVQIEAKANGHYAVLMRLDVTLNGETRSYSGWGESENAKAPIKSAESDAVKRIAAMYLGLGLHLWSRDHYFLPRVLEDQSDVLDAAEEAAKSDADYGGDGDEEPDSEEPTKPEPRPRAARAKKDDPPPAAPAEASNHGMTEAEAEANAAALLQDRLGAEPVDAPPRTDAQNRQLQALRRELKIPDERWSKRLRDLYGVGSSSELSRDQADDLIRRMQAGKRGTDGHS